MTYTLTSKKAIAFYDQYNHIDFNLINEVFVDILERLMDSANNKIDHSQHTLLLNQLLTKIDSIEQQQTTSLFNHFEQFSQNMRELIRSNHGDNERSILSLINEKNTQFIEKLDSISENPAINQFISQELENLSKTLITQTESLKNNDLINKLIEQKYSELDKNIQTKIDCFITNNNMNSQFGEICSKLNNNIDTIDNINLFLQKQMGSNSKGKLGENRLEIILSKLFPSAIINNTAGQTACGDFILERRNKSKILIDTKDYDTVVPIKEVEKILRDIETNSCHGILISQKSGIAQKNDFEISFHHNFIIIFIHNANYDPEKIRLATNIIDHLEPIINQNNTQSTETISSQLLLEINKEYQELVSQKLNIIQLLKKQHLETISQINKIDLPKLTQYLNKKFANTGKTAFHCDICNQFTGKNAKSLAAHQRKCQKCVVINTLS